MTYSLSSFDYDLPPDLIAQYPLAERDASRLLSLDRETGRRQHLHFSDLPELLDPGDILVVNRSRVIPARLSAIRENGREAEVLLVREIEPSVWTAMVHPGGKLKKGRTLSFGQFGGAEIVDVIGGGLRVIRFEHPDVMAICEAMGAIPLPPYIARPVEASDVERYQTIFAEDAGSVAAPTAGLHFTRSVLNSLHEREIQTVEITLHVGPGTFKPVSDEDISRHRMHSEYFHVSDAGAARINETRARGSRVCAVGTTSARVLESTTDGGVTRSGEGFTDIFIRPPYSFKGCDALLTNFHLPRSTLLMLVSAFANIDVVLDTYGDAIERKYRFFSYGDAMIIL